MPRTADVTVDLNKRLERAISNAEMAADDLRDAAADLVGEKLDLDEKHYRAHNQLVSACQWLIQQQSFPPFSEQTIEQRDLVEALEACGARPGV